MAPRWLTLTASVRVDRDGDYGRHRDDPSALAHLEVGRVEPEIGPRALQRTVEEILHPLIDVLAQLRHRALGDAGEPHRLHQFVHPPGRDATDPGFLDDGDQGLLRGPAGLQEAGKIRALPELRHPQVQRAQPGLKLAVAIAVAPGEAAIAALVTACADHALDVVLH
jgi:hypothetical protein